MEQIAEWGESALNKQGHTIIGERIKIKEHKGSCVLMYRTNNRNFFLKYTAKYFLHELPVLEFLNSNHFQNLPKIIAKNNEETAFLMEDAGISLHQKLARSQNDPTLELSKTYSILENYADLQIKCIPHKTKLLSLKVIDLRLQKLRGLYIKCFVENDEFYAQSGLLIQKLMI